MEVQFTYHYLNNFTGGKYLFIIEEHIDPIYSPAETKGIFEVSQKLLLLWVFYKVLADFLKNTTWWTADKTQYEFQVQVLWNI